VCCPVARPRPRCRPGPRLEAPGQFVLLALFRVAPFATARVSSTGIGFGGAKGALIGAGADCLAPVRPQRPCPGGAPAAGAPTTAVAPVAAGGAPVSADPGSHQPAARTATSSATRTARCAHDRSPPAVGRYRWPTWLGRQDVPGPCSAGSRPWSCRCTRSTLAAPRNPLHVIQVHDPEIDTERVRPECSARSECSWAERTGSRLPAAAAGGCPAPDPPVSRALGCGRVFRADLLRGVEAAGAVPFLVVVRCWKCCASVARS